MFYGYIAIIFKLCTGMVEDNVKFRSDPGLMISCSSASSLTEHNKGYCRETVSTIVWKTIVEDRIRILRKIVKKKEKNDDFLKLHGVRHIVVPDRHSAEHKCRIQDTGFRDR
jgi:hypothetical protein